RVHLAMDTWTPGSWQTFVAKRAVGGGAVAAYQFAMNASNRLVLTWAPSAFVQMSATATVETGLGDGVLRWVRATLDVNNQSGGHTVTFFTSPNGSTWTPLSSAVTVAGTTSIHNNAGD